MERQAYLDTSADGVRRAFATEPMTFPPLEAYDETFHLQAKAIALAPHQTTFHR
jgi:hypothetical protein